ncbi:hypothetical protein EVAR_61446_1 [Eumeta japonica]|uniref:Uncharacterized protein n=1 Tax=Eumeta variegata TaxID=151549 RepID=A0A4C1Z129_EUMVA|nr:hypothetical protein EVAR_61446_1 [Eumeta japonica]
MRRLTRTKERCKHTAVPRAAMRVRAIFINQILVLIVKRTAVTSHRVYASSQSHAATAMYFKFYKRRSKNKRTNECESDSDMQNITHESAGGVGEEVGDGEGEEEGGGR